MGALFLGVFSLLLLLGAGAHAKCNEAGMGILEFQNVTSSRMTVNSQDVVPERSVLSDMTADAAILWVNLKKVPTVISVKGQYSGTVIIPEHCNADNFSYCGVQCTGAVDCYNLTTYNDCVSGVFKVRAPACVLCAIRNFFGFYVPGLS